MRPDELTLLGLAKADCLKFLVFLFGMDLMRWVYCHSLLTLLSPVRWVTLLYLVRRHSFQLTSTPRLVVFWCWKYDFGGLLGLASWYESHNIWHNRSLLVQAAAMAKHEYNQLSLNTLFVWGSIWSLSVSIHRLFLSNLSFGQVLHYWLSFMFECEFIQISCIENVSHLNRLRVLNLAGNKISIVENLQGLDSLTELNLRYNCISVVVRGLFANSFIQSLLLHCYSYVYERMCSGNGDFMPFFAILICIYELERFQ